MVAACRRVEIVHESLLVQWPRLVRWRAQDSDGLVLRDQLRQAADIWDARGRPVELLWSGEALREYESWRKRDATPLSARETSFTTAMVSRARIRRRRLHAALLAAVASICAAAVTMAYLWRSTAAEAKRAESEKLIALAQLQLDRAPTVALAYFIAALELVDSPTARVRALDALSRGPVARMLELPPDEWFEVDLTPDARWLSVVSQSGPDFLLSSDGSQRIPIAPMVRAKLDPEGRFLLGSTSDALKLVSIPDGRLVRTIRKDFNSGISAVPAWTFKSTIFASLSVGANRRGVYAWPYADRSESLLSSFSGVQSDIVRIHPSGRWRAVCLDGIVYRQWPEPASSAPEPLWQPRERPTRLIFDPAGEQLASFGESVVEVWSAPTKSVRTFRRPSAAPSRLLLPRFSRDGGWLIWGTSETSSEAWVWNLAGPPDAEPLRLRMGASHELGGAAMSRDAQWIATSSSAGVIAVWDARQPRSYTFPGRSVSLVQLSPDASWLISCGIVDNLQLIALRAGLPSRAVAVQDCNGVALNPRRAELLTTGNNVPVHLVDLTTGTSREIAPRVPGNGLATAFSPSGEFAAAVFGSGPGRPLPERGILRVFDLRSETKYRDFALPDGPLPVIWIGFGADGFLYSAGQGTGIRRWDPTTGKHDHFYGRTGETASMSVSADGRFILAAVGDGRVAVTGELVLFDLHQKTRRRITAHGAGFHAVALDPLGRLIATRDTSGVLRISSIAGEEPHLIFGLSPTGTARGLSISRDGRWIAAASESEIGVWPVPDVSKAPIHTQQRDAFLKHLRDATNLRVERDASAEDGYKVTAGPFRWSS